MAQAACIFAPETRNESWIKHDIAMKNTEYNADNLASMISSESSLSTLLEMMGDMGLELDSATRS